MGMMPPGWVKRIDRKLIHPSAWKGNSRKFISKILHSPTPLPPESPIPGAPLGPAPLELVTPMDRYAGLWMFSRREQVFVVTDFQLLHMLSSSLRKARVTA